MISSQHPPARNILVDVETAHSTCCDSFASARGVEISELRSRLQRRRNLANAFLEVASLVADRPMWVDASRTLSYGWFQAAASDICGRLTGDSTFRRGNRVVLRQANSPEYLACFYGVLLAGGVVVPLSPTMEQQRFDEILRQTEASHVLTHAPSRSRQHDWQESENEYERFTIGRMTSQTCMRRSRSPNQRATPRDDLAVILYTSGSSGQPKGVMLSHANLLSNATSIQEYLRLTSQDRPLCLLPFQYAFGNSIVQSHVLCGACLVHGGSAMFPQSILAAATRHRATSISGVPSLFQLLFQRTDDSNWNCPDLRYMSVAGGALHPALVTHVAVTISPAQLFVMYGQTEATARLAYLPPEEIARRPNSIGRAIPGVTLEVVDDNGIPVPVGKRGELRAAGPNIMVGYWRDLSETRKVLRDNWLYTGDIATVDQHGWITIVGRRCQWVKVAGHRVHPQEIERFVMSECHVESAVVVPFQDPAAETRLAMFVAGSDVDLDSIAAYCRRMLASFKVPLIIKHLEKLPRMDSAKIDRRSLTQCAENEFRDLVSNRGLPPTSNMNPKRLSRIDGETP